jgi:hypothetical protein
VSIAVFALKSGGITVGCREGVRDGGGSMRIRQEAV